MKYITPKGTRDLFPEEKILKNYLVDTLKTVFETYGFNPIETPSLEMYKTCTAKFSAGEGTDVLDELFTLKDRAERILGLRYELTFPFARFIANNPQIPKPFKRYQIDRVWRNGPIKLGRYREFWQADADIVGNEKIEADAEILAMTNKIFKELDLEVVIKINSRKLLDEILKFCKVPKESRNSVTIIIDKLDKIGKKGVKEELKKRDIKEKTSEKILNLIEIEDIKKLEKELGKSAENGIKELKELFRLLKNFNVKNYEFSPSLARGLIYYTGTIFEVYLKGSKIKSSVAAGGRWDDMIAKFGGNEKVPAVGISFGLDVLIDALNLKLKKKEMKKSIVDIFIIPINELEKSIEIAEKLREKGIKTDIDLSGKNISKNLSYADSFEIPYVLIVGSKDLKNEKVTLKNMKTGKEEKIPVKKISKVLR